jgi:polysaccharide biosynthesis protein PslG
VGGPRRGAVRLLVATVAFALLVAAGAAGSATAVRAAVPRAGAAGRGHAAARPPAKVPAGFFGAVPDAPLGAGGWSAMAELGLSDRFQVVWAEVEPEAGRFEWAGVDAIVAEAAARGLKVMPEVYGTPTWVAPEASEPPLGAEARVAWAGFLQALVHRYGPGGEFWAGWPHAAPIRRWQIWNEPNYPLFWQPRPSPSGYVHLLQVSKKAIQEVDPKAQIVAAGLAPIEHEPPPWKFLQEMYAVRGARRAFEAAALHPYTNSLRGLGYSVASVRRVMAQAGDSTKPLFLTELGVSSAGGSAFDLGLEGQAEFLRGAMTLLARQRLRWHLGGVFWFTWADSTGEAPGCPFCDNSGLFGIGGEPKPAWAALRQVVARWG